MCGIAGIYAHQNVSGPLYYALNALQHRGQESCGIAVSSQGTIDLKKGMGLVQDVFGQRDLQALKGSVGIGHVRYSTAGGSHAYNVQPMVGFARGRHLALAHNGNLINCQLLRTRLEEDGVMFQTSMDSEVILYLIARYYQDDLFEAIFKTMDLIQGAYSVVLTIKDKLVAVRDPHGFRPLVMGRRGEDFVFASENAALDVLDATFERDVAPGEVIVIKEGQAHSRRYPGKMPKQPAFCIFEQIYFARPDAVLDGQSVYEFRVRAGRRLAEKAPVEADLVVPVPDSGFPGAIGYAAASGLPLAEGLVKNRYMGRTFIKPTQEEREQAVRLKLNPLRQVVEGKRLVLVDDSIVRGTTSKRLVSALRQAGAKEVHLRVTSPPVTHPCYFGMDTPERRNLLAANATVEEMREIIGCDSLEFLSLQDLRQSCHGGYTFCSGCFTGNYPVDPCVL